MKKVDSFSRFETVKSDNLRAPNVKFDRNLSADTQEMNNKSSRSADDELHLCVIGDEYNEACRRYEGLLSEYSRIKEIKREIEEKLSKEAKDIQDIEQKLENSGIVRQLEIKPFKQIKKCKINQFIQENDTENHDKNLSENYKSKYLQLYSDYSNLFELYKKIKNTNNQDFKIKRLVDENEFLKENDVLLKNEINHLANQIYILQKSENNYNIDKYNNLKKKEKVKMIMEKDLIIKNQFSIIIRKDLELEKLKTDINELRLIKLN